MDVSARLARLEEKQRADGARAGSKHFRDLPSALSDEELDFVAECQRKVATGEIAEAEIERVTAIFELAATRTTEDIRALPTRRWDEQAYR